VVGLGAIALQALGLVSPHPLRVRDAGRVPLVWNGRWLAAVYHPSARAAIHRPVDAQIEDFQCLGRWLADFSAGTAAWR
jgi:DNA polymerase